VRFTASSGEGSLDFHSPSSSEALASSSEAAASNSQRGVMVFFLLKLRHQRPQIQNFEKNKTIMLMFVFFHMVATFFNLLPITQKRQGKLYIKRLC
jgi:hypothetical protein